MSDFASGEIQLLVSTTVIEVGVDVPNAAVMVIENAESFGLSQLHQLRGRIGRGSRRSVCLLIHGKNSDESADRLKIMRDTSDGFKVAEADLEKRGPGDFFGRRQHGLPELRIADMMEDTDILEETGSAARALIAADPQLTRPEHELLKAQVNRLFEENLSTC